MGQVLPRREAPFGANDNLDPTDHRKMLVLYLASPSFTTLCLNSREVRSVVGGGSRIRTLRPPGYEPGVLGH